MVNTISTHASFYLCIAFSIMLIFIHLMCGMYLKFFWDYMYCSKSGGGKELEEGPRLEDLYVLSQEMYGDFGTRIVVC